MWAKVYSNIPWIGNDGWVTFHGLEAFHQE